MVRSTAWSVDPVEAKAGVVPADTATGCGSGCTLKEPGPGFATDSDACAVGGNTGCWALALNVSRNEAMNRHTRIAHPKICLFALVAHLRKTAVSVVVAIGIAATRLLAEGILDKA